VRIKKPKLSRKVKTILYISVVLLVLATVIVGNYPITPWSAFRLAEKAYLVKPAKILGTESVVSAGQDGIIIAKSEELCMTYGYKHFSFHDSDDLVCRKKTGDLTFLSIATQNSYRDQEDKYFSIILFDEYPQAVRATLSLTPSVEYGSNDGKEFYERSFTVSATRRAGEYFLFRMNTDGDFDAWMKTPLLMDNLRMSLNDNSVVTDPVPGKIQLYDKDGNLILEREIDLRDPSK